ncbi:MAG TPA: TadE/TadG family type IV pilus assembly protein [Terriglobales bacterium]|nr:TadE/TadG family type IV pilus assembly protein [Terriglobales bacterium]
MRRIRRRTSDPQRGTVIVELAILLPFLLLLAFLVMEGGAMIRTHIVLNNAAREAARVSAQPEFEGQIAKVKQAALDYAALNGVDLSADQVTVIQDDAVPGPDGTLMSASSVAVERPYSLPYLSAFSGLADSTQLYARAEFRNFY